MKNLMKFVNSAPRRIVASQETRLSVNIQELTLETALRQTFHRAGVSFVIPYDLSERVTLQLRDQTLERVLTRLWENSQEALELDQVQGVWRVRMRKSSDSDTISLSLKSVPLRVALAALQPYLPGLSLVLERVSSEKRVTYSRDGIAPRRALAEILKLVGPGMSAETRKPGELEIRFGEPPPFTGRLAADFRRAELRDAVSELIRQTRLDNVILFSPTESAKVTLRLEGVTFDEALRALCKRCVPPAVLTQSEGMYFIFPKK